MKLLVLRVPNHILKLVSLTVFYILDKIHVRKSSKTFLVHLMEQLEQSSGTAPPLASTGFTHWASWPCIFLSYKEADCSIYTWLGPGAHSVDGQESREEKRGISKPPQQTD